MEDKEAGITAAALGVHSNEEGSVIGAPHHQQGAASGLMTERVGQGQISNCLEPLRKVLHG